MTDKKGNVSMNDIEDATLEYLKLRVTKLQAALDVAKNKILKHHAFWAHEPDKIHGCSSECKTLCELLGEIEGLLK